MTAQPKLRAQLLNDVGIRCGRGHARAQIIAAAIDVFAKHGVAATRVEDILVAAELSRRTFYQHFDDKLAVVHAIYELVLRYLAETLVVATAGTTDPIAAIERSLDAYFEVHRTDRDIVRPLIEESLRADSPLFPLRARFRDQIARALAVVLATTDRFVPIALISALEGVSLELLSRDITDRDVVQARTVIVGMLKLIRDHGV